MDRDLIVILVAVAIGVALLAVGAAAFLRGRRARAHRGELKQRFGPEYEALSRERGERRAARELRRREKRVSKLHIEPLPEGERSKYATAWEATQRRFVDDPGAAVHEADELVQKVMSARGYPVADFEQRVKDVSVDHANLVSTYRSARVLAERAERGEASTEELRKALVHYRVLFSELLEEGGGPRGPVPFGKERYA